MQRRAPLAARTRISLRLTVIHPARGGDMEYLDTLSRIIDDVVLPSASLIDERGTFPRSAVGRWVRRGCWGSSAPRTWAGSGKSHRAATQVVERVAAACASTAMVALHALRRRRRHRGARPAARSPRGDRARRATSRRSPSPSRARAAISGPRSSTATPKRAASGSTRRRAGSPRPERPTPTSGRAGLWRPRATAPSGSSRPTRPGLRPGALRRAGTAREQFVAR